MRTVAALVALVAASGSGWAADPAAKARGEAAGRDVGSAVSSGFNSFAGEVEGFFNGLGQPSRPARPDPRRRPEPARPASR